MAFQVGDACYGTAVQAAQSKASSVLGGIVQHAGASYTVDVSATADTSITYVLTPVVPGTAITTVAAYTPQPCNLLELQDGLTIGWMIAAAWIATYAVLFLTRALRGETGESYGNS